jgi:hypothetical protein
MIRMMELMLWTLAAATLAGTALHWLAAGSAPGPDDPPLRPPAPLVAPRESGSVASVADGIVATNPFRLDRRPADPPFAGDDAMTTEWSTEEVEPDFLALAVAAIIGPPWEAVLEGVPGREHGVVVRPGDVLGDLVVRSVGPNTVWIESDRDSWHLELKRPWP